VRKRYDLDLDLDADPGPAAFVDAECRTSGNHVDVACSHAFRYTDADALGGPAACPGYAATDDVACCTGPGRVMLSA
jgi:hypothetical protein